MLNVLSTPQTLRVVAAVLAAAAAWGPGGCSRGRLERTVVVDASLSCDAAAVALGDVVAGRAPAGALRMVVFGDGALAAWDGGARSAAEWDALFSAPGLPQDLPRPPGTASDLAAALATAASVAGGRGPFEVLVVGDGSSTSTDAELGRAAVRLRDAGCVSIDWYELPRRPSPPHVSRTTGPGRVRLGALVGLTVAGRAPAAGGRLELVRDGSVVDARRVPGGDFQVAFLDRPERSGACTYHARLDGVETDLPARAHVVVVESGRVLLLTDRPDPEPLATSLGVPAVVAGSDVLNLDELLAAHRVAVVDGAPPSRVGRALEAWVRRGGGLLLLDVAATAGDAPESLADASPLRARAPDESGAFVYLGVDGSGSMAQPWPGGRGTRDEVVRAAVRGVLHDLGPETEVALRRFADRLQPVDAPPWVGYPADEPAVVARAISAWPAPGGGTVLVPVLAEAARLAAARGQRTRRVVVFTDGRVADDPADVSAAARRLVDGGARLTVVVDAAEGRDALGPALGERGVEVLLVGDALSLSQALRAAATSRDTETARDVLLRVTDGGRGVPGLDAPARAAQVARRWAAGDARVLVETGRSWPVAAVRRHGEGRVAALAGRAADGDWLADGPAARSLLAALCAVVAPPAAGDVHVRREGDELLVRPTGIAPALAELDVDGVARRVALRPGRGGLLRASVPRAAGGLVRLLAGDGTELATVGLDRPGATEHIRSRPVDRERLAALAVAASREERSTTRPWLAALAVLALVAAHLHAARIRSSRGGLLPI